jgi:hypothetical protein
MISALFAHESGGLLSFQLLPPAVKQAAEARATDGRREVRHTPFPSVDLFRTIMVSKIMNKSVD